MPSPGAPLERAALSRELSEFLVELSISLNKYAIYPQSHPALGPAAAGIARRAEVLLEGRPTLSLGVARHQLVIEGVATDPRQPVLSDLALRLHRHHLGAVTFRRGVSEGEVAAVLRALAADAERGGLQPIGLGPPDALRAWRHIELHPVTFAQLELLDHRDEEPQGEGPRAPVWIGLAQAALATGEGPEASPPPTDPVAIAQMIEEHPQSPAYDRAIVGYLQRISGELKTAAGPESVALRRGVSQLVSAMRPETLRRLLEMGGDEQQRRQFVLDASHGMAVDAVLDIVTAAAAASGQTISHSLLRMFRKMAQFVGEERGAAGQHADVALREQVRSLVAGWTLEDPNPGGYGAALQALARRSQAPSMANAAFQEPEAARMVQIGLELDHVGVALWRAISAVVDGGQVGVLVDLLDNLPAYHETGRDVWRRLVSPGVVRRLLVEPADFKTLDRLLPRLDAQAVEALFDALVESPHRATRRALLDRLARAPVDVSDMLLARLADHRWYVQRNMLVLLDALPKPPEGFSPAPYAGHADARVRREALKLRLKLPTEREAGMLAGAQDPDPQVVQLALIAAQQSCPAPVLQAVTRRFADPTFGPELRLLAIKVLGRAHSPDALHALLEIVDGGTTWLGRRRLPPKSPELLAALVALAGGWSRHPRARAVLGQAGRANDAEIRAAAGAMGAR